MQRPIFAPDLFVIEPRFGRRIHERFVNPRRDLEITVDRAVSKLDLESAQPFTVTDSRERF